MVGTLGKVASLFRPTTWKSSGDCTITMMRRRDVGEDATAAEFLKRLPTSDVVVWTDGFDPSTLRAGGAGWLANNRECMLHNGKLKGRSEKI